MAAAAHTPFESTHRVFVLERADTMNDEAANSLLKTLEEPPAYVVLLLLTDRPTQVLPTIASRCQPVRFDPLPPRRSRSSCSHTASRRRPPPRPARGSRLGDGEKALALALGDGPALQGTPPRRSPARPLHKQIARRAPVAGRSSTRARARGTAAKAAARGGARRGARVPAQEGAPRRETEYTERARRADRRAATEALDHALQLAGLWYRDLGLRRRPGAPELALPRRPRRGARTRTPAAARRAAQAPGARRRHPRPARPQRQRGAGLRGARLPARGDARHAMTEVQVRGAYATVQRPRPRGRGRGRGAARDPRRRPPAGRHDAHAGPRRGARARLPARRGPDRRRARTPARRRPRGQHVEVAGPLLHGARRARLLHDVELRRVREGRARGGRGRRAPRRPRARASTASCSPPCPTACSQPTFERTGGLHATGLFTPDGELVVRARGRRPPQRHGQGHRLGAARTTACPLHDHVLCVCGRLSFELVQKAAVAGRADPRRRRRADARSPSVSPTTAA